MKKMKWMIGLTAIAALLALTGCSDPGSSSSSASFSDVAGVYMTQDNGFTGYKVLFDNGSGADISSSLYKTKAFSYEIKGNTLTATSISDTIEYTLKKNGSAYTLVWTQVDPWGELPPTVYNYELFPSWTLDTFRFVTDSSAVNHWVDTNYGGHGSTYELDLKVDHTGTFGPSASPADITWEYMPGNQGVYIYTAGTATPTTSLYARKSGAGDIELGRIAYSHFRLDANKTFPGTYLSIASDPSSASSYLTLFDDGYGETGDYDAATLSISSHTFRPLVKWEYVNGQLMITTYMNYPFSQSTNGNFVSFYDISRIDDGNWSYVLTDSDYPDDSYTAGSITVVDRVELTSSDILGTWTASMGDNLTINSNGTATQGSDNLTWEMAPSSYAVEMILTSDASVYYPLFGKMVNGSLALYDAQNNITYTK